MRITLGGNGEPRSGQRRSPSNATSYRWTEPGLSPSIATIASVMARDLEGARARPQHLYLAGAVCLDPDRRLRVPDVTQQRTQHQ